MDNLNSPHNKSWNLEWLGRLIFVGAIVAKGKISALFD